MTIDEVSRLIDILPGTLAHATAIADVHVRSWQAAYADILDKAFLDRLDVVDRARRWEPILQQNDSRTLVARSGEGEVVGFVNLGPWRAQGAVASQGEIRALYVAPACWGQKVGAALLTRALAALREEGDTEVLLWVLSRNERGLAFYRRFGFRPVAGSAKDFELGGRAVEEICLQLRHDA